MAKPLAVEVRRERIVGEERFGYALQQEIEEGETYAQVFRATEEIVLDELNRVAPDPKQIAAAAKKADAKARASELAAKRKAAQEALEAEEAELASEFGDIWSPDLISEALVEPPAEVTPIDVTTTPEVTPAVVVPEPAAVPTA